MTTENKNQPAFPLDQNTETGLTKREYFAALAMQGLLANPSITANESGCAKIALTAADALLKELEATA